MFDGPIVSSSKKKQKSKTSYSNPYEVLQELGSDVIYEAKHHLLDESKKVIFQQLFGGDLHPGQEVDLKNHQDQKKTDQQEKAKSLEKKANNIRPAIDYVGEILKSSENASWKETRDIKQEIQTLITELKNLASSTKALEKEIVEATGNTVVNPGKYHKSFFQYMLSIIRDAKAKIDNAGVWLSAMNGKQKKKGMGMGKKKKSNYWDMAKKHGTQFSLSGERGVATQSA